MMNTKTTTDVQTRTQKAVAAGAGENKDSNLGKAETKPEGPPKRGWWQRITR